MNTILRRFPDIESANQKLWIATTEVLQTLLNNDVFTNTAMTIDAIKSRLSLLFPTKVLSEARSKLEEDNVCILCGGPGVGKTSIAEMLLVEHIRNGWQPIVVSHNVSEAMRVIRIGDGKKQIVYYDDFLGQISDERKLAKNEDSLLITLINAVRSSKDKRFLLTTREYILQQARQFSEKLHRSDLDINRFTVRCQD